MMPHAVFAVSAPAPSWLIRRARAEAAKAPPLIPAPLAEAV